MRQEGSYRPDAWHDCVIVIQILLSHMAAHFGKTKAASFPAHSEWFAQISDEYYAELVLSIVWWRTISVPNADMIVSAELPIDEFVFPAIVYY